MSQQNPLTLLQSPDPAQRRDAIIALGRLRDSRALPHLAEVYHNDPVPELRQLAYQAGQHIQQAAAAAPAASAAPSTAPRPRLQPVASISAVSAERAKALYERALTAHMQGQNDQAARHLGKALEMNPNMAFDAMTRNLATALTGLDPDEAVLVLAHPEARERHNYRYLGNESSVARVRQSREQAVRPVRPLDVGLDVLLYLGVAVLGVILPFVIIIIRLGAFGFRGLGMDFLQLIFEITLPGALFSTLIVVLATAAMHGTAALLGGRASPWQFGHAVIPIHTKATLIVVGVISGIIFLAVFFFIVPGFMMQEDTWTLFSLALILGTYYWVFLQVTIQHELDLGRSAVTVGAGVAVLIVGVIIANALEINLAFGSFGGLVGAGGLGGF